MDAILRKWYPHDERIIQPRRSIKIDNLEDETKDTVVNSQEDNRA